MIHELPTLLRIFSSSEKRKKAIVKALLAGGRRRWKVIGRVKSMPRNRDEVNPEINNLPDDFFKKLYRIDRSTDGSYRIRRSDLKTRIHEII